MSNNLNLVVNFSAIDRLTKPYRKVIKTNSQFSKGVIKSANELDKLNKTQRKIARYRKLEQRLSQGANKADKFRAELKDLKQQIRVTERPTKKLTDAYNKKQRQLKDLVKVNRRYSSDLSKTRSELRKTGINTRKLGNEQDRLKQKIDGASKALERQVKRQSKYQRLKDKAKAGVAIAAGTGLSVRASAQSFTSNENADADLRIALLNNSGSLPVELLMIQKQAKQLGNKLPGTTADFFNVARTLSEQGVQAKLISDGGLKAASELAVVLKMVPEEAAKMTAKARESFGLAADELVSMADLTQRAKFAFGLTPDELGEANKYAAPTLNALKLTGINNARLVLAIEGLSARKGLEGSSFGTSLSRFLDGATVFQTKIQTKARSEQLKQLSQNNLNYDFFDSKGKFRGLEHAVKLTESWKKTLNDQQFATLIDSMFGDQGKRIAEIIAGEGAAGFTRAQEMLAKQASIQQRIGVQMSTLSAKHEATTGSLSNLAATLFQPIAEPIKHAYDWLNRMIGATDEWLGSTNKLGKYSASLLAIAGAAKISALGTQALFGTANLVAPSAMLAITKRLKATRLFAWLGKIRGAFGFLGRGIGVVLRLLPLLLTPWGLIGLAVGALAVAIYKNWDAIKHSVSNGIDLVKSKINGGIEYLKSTKERWLNSGKEMINGLVIGVTQGAKDLSTAIKDLASKPIKEFKELLGINSPSRVFAKLGGHLSEGLAVGIDYKAPNAYKAVAKLSKNLPKKVPALAVSTAIAATPYSLAAQPNSNGVASQTFAPTITINIQPGTHESATDIASAVRIELEKAMRAAKQKHNTRLFD